MKRRQFLLLLGGAAVWPLAAWTQQIDRVRRIGVLMGLVANDPEAQSRVAAFENGLRELGWVKGHKDKAKIIANLTMICAALMILPTVSS
jgi:putative ABC transport system substrate-binding protein